MACVLVVDDEQLIRFTVGEILEGVGFRAEFASDGREGLERLGAGGIDLVICDLLMPEMDGVELIARIRRDYPDLRIIAMSGGGRTRNLDFLKVAERAGADKILTKPFEPTELLQLVASMLDKR